MNNADIGTVAAVGLVLWLLLLSRPRRRRGV